MTLVKKYSEFDSCSKTYSKVKEVHEEILDDMFNLVIYRIFMVIKKRVQIDVFARLDAFRAVYFELSTFTRLKLNLFFKLNSCFLPNF